jgi:hypothetical protein
VEWVDEQGNIITTMSPNQKLSVSINMMAKPSTKQVLIQRKTEDDENWNNVPLLLNIDNKEVRKRGFHSWSEGKDLHKCIDLLAVTTEVHQYRAKLITSDNRQSEWSDTIILGVLL